MSAIGLAPRVGLARAAGLQVAQGIVTDGYCSTSAPDVYALGDCAEVEGKVRPYVLPIMHAARALAATLCGEPTLVRFPVMPITVKTPAIPVVVAPAPAEAGNWVIETSPDADGDALHALCVDPGDGSLLGFSLMGSATKKKAELVRQMEARG
ncbi:Rubredoxin-NAD(+) reductase [compost metagenome]